MTNTKSADPVSRSSVLELYLVHSAQTKSVEFVQAASQIVFGQSQMVRSSCKSLFKRNIKCVNRQCDETRVR